MIFSKNKKPDLEPDQLEQFEYAQKRIKQKKRLMRHFILFLAGSIFLIILNPILGVGKDFFIKDWFVWAILLWIFFFLIHVLNVFIFNRFMGKDWEKKQLQKLKAKQEQRILALQEKVEKEMPLPEVKKNQDPQQKSQDL
jgi:hypothetical protein